MFISHKSNVLQQFHETEWNCRRKTKGLDKPEYWTWIETITDSDGVPDYSGESGYTIVECTDEDVQARLNQLGDYTSMDGVYNIKYYATKRDSEIDGVKSHFIGDDTARDKRILDQKWADIRERRNRELTESDWVVIKAKEEHANASIDSSWIDYRTALRDITKQSDPDDITWPTKP
jgi:hypothetical protein